MAAAHVRRGVAAGLSAFTPREALIVPWRDGLEAYEPQSRQAIGDRLGICHEHVWQLEKQALAHLRRFPQRAELAELVQSHSGRITPLSSATPWVCTPPPWSAGGGARRRSSARAATP